MISQIEVYKYNKTIGISNINPSFIEQFTYVLVIYLLNTGLYSDTTEKY